MKTIDLEIKYNPYLVTTVIKQDGEKVEAGNSLYVKNGVRLQEWIEDLPKIFNNKSFSVSFIGTKSDYEDVEIVCKSCGAVSTLKSEMDSVEIAEREINKIYKEIQEGPIEELKTSSIREAFEKAESSEFEVNVVATMSSGKSTLINALLGKQLMPAANVATTSTIVRIKDVDGKDVFSATAYDKKGNKVGFYSDLTLSDMQELNSNPNVFRIDIEGDIKFVSSDGMSLVLVDTPGPNNSNDLQHQEMTFQMLEKSDKSLVLFVMNGKQLGINDEKVFLDFICDNMRNGGKKSRDRYLFAVNQMDNYNPNQDKDGPDCVQKALESVRTVLNKKGICEANIFPVTAGAALELRIKDEEEDVLGPFRKKVGKYEEMHLYKYYDYSHLPKSSQMHIKECLAKDPYDLEINSGVVNIEEAIRLYINKYARTTKVSNLVLSFNWQLDRLATLAKLSDSIQKDEEKRELLKRQIEKTKMIISKSEISKKLAKDINQMNLSSEVKKEVRSIISDTRHQFCNLVKDESTKVDKRVAEGRAKTIERYYSQYIAQTNVRISNIIRQTFNDNINRLISQFENVLGQIGIGNAYVKASTFSVMNISTPSGIGSVLGFTRIEDESYWTTESYQEKIDSNRGKGVGIGTASGLTVGAAIGSIVPGVGTAVGAAVGTLFGAICGRLASHKEYYETRVKPVKVEQYGEYVDMKALVNDILNYFYQDLDKLQNHAYSYIDDVSHDIKDKTIKQVESIEGVVMQELQEQLTLTNNKTKTEEEKKEKERRLNWLIKIQQRINKLVMF